MRRRQLKITITTYLNVGHPDTWKHAYPGCETLQEVADSQKRMIDDGECSLVDVLGDNVDVTVEPVAIC